MEQPLIQIPRHYLGFRVDKEQQLKTKIYTSKATKCKSQLSAVQLREKHEKVFQANKRQDINAEIYLPNIKPLKPPGFSLQQKTQKNKERIVKAAIQSSLQAQTKEYYQGQRNSSNGNQRSDYECVFQHIQTSKSINQML
eukprot:403358591